MVGRRTILYLLSVDVLLSVDKIVICQEAFGRFVNDTCPGAYSSMTQVDFATLDTLQIKPLGLYGSQSEIVRYLQDMKVLDEQV